jgi:hypothetical protein
MMRHRFRIPRMRALSALITVALLAACGGAQAGFLNDSAEFGYAMAALRSAIGEHPRVLRIEVDTNVVTIEAQDPRNRLHVDRWQYGVVNVLGVLPVKRNVLTGPEAVQLQLVNPNLEANLFDLDAADLSAMPKLMEAALARAKLQDVATVTQIEIARQTFILPNPSSGDIRWTLHVDSGRERAKIYANGQGDVVGADLSNTQRAKTLNLFDEPELVADAAAAFRATVGAGPVLKKVAVSDKRVGFATNIHDEVMAKLRFGMPFTVGFTWDLDGLHQRIGDADARTMVNIAGPAPFSIDDVNWRILAQIEQDALARLAIPNSTITGAEIAWSWDQPGRPVLVWTIEIVEPSGEKSSVIADLQGAILRVVLPARRRSKVDWHDAATIAAAIARIAPTFGREAKIAQIDFDDDGGSITIEERENGDQLATFKFSSDSVTRASLSFGILGTRFSAVDVAPLNEQMIAALEAEALKRLGGKRTPYPQSVTIRVYRDAPAIEVTVRDSVENSMRAHHARIVFDFNGRVVDIVTF